MTSGTGAAPAAPSNLSVVNPASSSLTVYFRDNATNETGIDIERKTGAAGAWAVVITTNPLPGTSDGWWWQNNGLTAGTEYCYRLRAKNGGTYSAYTGEVCNSTSGGAAAPAAPSNLSVVNPASSSLTVYFRDNATNETGIDIERKTGAGGTWAVVITTNPLPGTSDGWWWQNNGLAAGTQYCYRLRAKNGPALSAYSSEVCSSTVVSVSSDGTSSSTPTVTAAAPLLGLAPWRDAAQSR